MFLQRGKTFFKRVKGTHEELIKEVMEQGQINIPETVHSKSTAGKEDDYETKELCNFGFVIASIEDIEEALYSTVTNVNKVWARQEFQDRITNNPNPGLALEFDSKWRKMLEEGGKFSYTYGERWASQIPIVLEELKKNPNTRQAIITTWDSNIDQERLGKRRIPCSVYSQFLIRGGKLHQIYNIRSNDAIFIMPSDMYQQGKLQVHLADELGIKPGQLSYNVGSLHIYKKHAAIVKDSLGIEWT